MPYLDVYVGFLDDPSFSWGTKDQPGSLPRRQSPFFPPPTPFSTVVDRIKEGVWEGSQIDWAGWGAPMLARELRAFIEEIYGDSQELKVRYPGSPHLEKDLKDLRDFVASLDERVYYLVVACET